MSDEERRLARRSSADLADRVTQCVEEIRTVVGRTSVELSCRVGELVLRHFFGGNVACWRRRGVGDPSLRLLARDPRLPISASALWRSIHLYELFSELDAHGRWSTLGVAHFHAVLGRRLTHSEQARWLDRARDEHWSGVRLQAEVSRALSVEHSVRGRPPLDEPERFVRNLERMTTRLQECATKIPERLLEGRVSDDHLERLHRVRRHFESMLDELGRLGSLADRSP